MTPHSNTQYQAKSGKRPASVQLISDNGKRQRGRPRVAPTPENGTAADRRRTQIRLAQRAYRQRKETTIASCKHQVANLQKVIEDMNATFTKFTAEASKFGLTNFNYSLTKELELTAHKMDMLARRAEDLVSEDTRGDKSPDSQSAGEAVEARNDDITTTALDWNDTQTSTKRSTSASSGSTPPTVWGYSVIYEPEPKTDPSSSLLSQTNEKYREKAVTFNRSTEQARENQVYLQQNFSTQPEWSSQLTTQNFMTLSLPSPMTYSFNETTFARRLHRACLEDVYLLLSSPGASPDAIWKKFKFSLPQSSLADIRDRIKFRLSRSNTEPLHSPYQYKQNANGQNDTQTNNINFPHHIKSYQMLESPKSQVGVSDVMEDHDGWLSPEDIQKFVESKGFFFSPTATFAEGVVISLAPGPYSDNASVDASFLQSPPKTPDFLVKDVTLFSGYNTDVATGLNSVSQTPPSAVTQDDVLHGTLSHSNPSVDLQALSMYHRPALIRKRVVLNVVKFLNELVRASVCRGKTPKLRQEDVERAFHVSAIPV